jgi:hypothetical protein
MTGKRCLERDVSEEAAIGQPYLSHNYSLFKA